MRRPEPPRVSSLSALRKSVRDRCHAGINPKSRLLASDAAIANAEHRQIDSRRGDLWQGRGDRAREQRQRRRGEEHADSAAGDTQGSRLDEQLATQSRRRCADCCAHRELAPPVRRARQQQVGDVGAGDQQHQSDRAEHGQHHGPRVAHRDRPRADACPPSSAASRRSTAASTSARAAPALRAPAPSSRPAPAARRPRGTRCRVRPGRAVPP